MKKITIILFCFFSLSLNAQEVTFESGNSLYSALEEWSADGVKVQVRGPAAVGYIVGISDALNTQGNPKEEFVFCIVKAADKGKLADIVFKYLKDNPSIRQHAAVNLVRAALSESFPCKNKLGVE